MKKSQAFSDQHQEKILIFGQNTTVCSYYDLPKDVKKENGWWMNESLISLLHKQVPNIQEASKAMERKIMQGVPKKAQWPPSPKPALRLTICCVLHNPDLQRSNSQFLWKFVELHMATMAWNYTGPHYRHIESCKRGVGWWALIVSCKILISLRALRNISHFNLSV